MALRKLFMILLLTLSIGISSCGTDEPDSSLDPSSTTNSNISKPSFDKFLTTTDKDEFSIRARFKTGGDEEINMGAKVHWKAYSKKQSTTPSKSELSKTETMRQYGPATYHNTGSKKGMTNSIVFDKSHAGVSGGTYIYYYVECYNSVGDCESSVTYTVVKR